MPDGTFSVYQEPDPESLPEGAQSVKTLEQALSLAGQILSSQPSAAQSAEQSGFQQGLAETAPGGPGGRALMGAGGSPGMR